jgi:hypothetical protein
MPSSMMPSRGGGAPPSRGFWHRVGPFATAPIPLASESCSAHTQEGAQQPRHTQHTQLGEPQLEDKHCLRHPFLSQISTFTFSKQVIEGVSE